jgi:galactose mutarotase-like enzyme
MIINLSNNKILASINTIGAELSRLEKNNKNYIWTIDEAFWNKTSPILFPIVGRLKNDSFTFKNKLYALPRHGFARNFDFKIENQTENSALFSLESNAETLQQFPFEFELKMEYRLTENGLEIAYLVRNKSNEVMPFSIGAHPAFAIDDAFHNYSLVFNPSEKMISHQLENDQFDGSIREIEAKNGKINLDYSLFEKDALVFKELKSNEIILQHNNEFVLKMSFEGFPYLGIWTKPNAPFLCIEPWCGLADNVNHNGNIEEKEGINFLQPQEFFSRTIKIEL